MRKAEITAFLTLIFLLLISFIGSIMESASIQTAKNHHRANMNMAIESVFAEYQKELLEQFDIFTLEATYETGQYSEDAVMDRLSFYGAAGIDNKMQRVQFLTDQEGQAFREQAAAYVAHKYGLESLERLLGSSKTWEEQEEASSEYERKEQETQEELSDLLKENEGELPDQDNPLPNIDRLKRSPLADLVMPKDRQISNKQIDVADTLSNRRRQQGFGTFSDVAEERTISTLAFGEYLLEHFTSAVPEQPEGKDGLSERALNYELEYIIAGKGSDRENLESVIRMLLGIRFAPNYGYLMSDGKKRAEAEALALTLCTVLAVPAVTNAVSQVLLLAWAFGESVMDIRTLLKGNRVPLMKSEASWQLQLSQLLKLGTSEDQSDAKDTEGGIAYKEYLRMLLFLKKKGQISLRSLDMIEARLSKSQGMEWFRADYCISRMEIKSRCGMRRGITYEFKTYYGYR